jgi:hypothetical protein
MSPLTTPAPYTDSVVRPTLDRDTGQISLASAASAASSDLAVGLADFLSGNGVRAIVCDIGPWATSVQLVGVPDLDRVERLISLWHVGTP